MGRQETREETTDQAAPAQVGRYHLVKRLAVGGMAEVFLACERGGAMSLERLLVIKRILPHLAEDPAFVEMFLHEARVAARIQHHNVVQIIELGEAGGFPFIAMEYVAGSTLKALSKASTASARVMPLGVVIDLISQAAAGAQAAHDLTDSQGRSYGLVHRDLTPHNLMVTDQGHVKLLDFGIAKASELQDEATRTGMLKGKISYMSPEQCRQESLDRRSDIFSLGIVAWEMLAGRKPFASKSELSTMQAIIGGDLPHLREMRPDVPEAVSAVIHRAMSVDREQRYDTAQGFRDALRSSARSEAIAIERDQTSAYVSALVGARHAEVREQVDEALERTLVTLSQVPPAQSLTHDPVTETSARTLPQPTAVGAVGMVLGASIVCGGLGLAGLSAVLLREPPPPARPAGPAVTLHLAPTLEPDVVRANLEPVRLYLEQATQTPIDFVVAESYEAAAEAVGTGRAPLAMLPHGATLDALERHPGLQILATKVMDGASSTDGYLLVPRESGIRTLRQLQGHAICYPDLGSQTGYRLPREALADAGLDVDQDLTWVHSGSHLQLLRDLLQGRCQAGGTYSLNFQGAEADGVNIAALRVLTITDSVPHDHVVAAPNADPGLVQAFSEALLAFSPGPQGVGVTEHITGFVPGDGQYRP